MMTPNEHFSRRAFLKGLLATGAGVTIANWGGLFHSPLIAREAPRRYKRCILLMPGPLAVRLRPLAATWKGYFRCPHDEGR